MPEPEPYPAWVEGVVVANAEEEAAVREGRAVFETIKSAAGDTTILVGIKPRPEPPKAPEKKPEPEKKLFGRTIGRKTRKGV